MKISKKAREITPSLTRKLFNLAQNYNDVIDLTLGDPDMATPDQIKIAACSAINEDKTHYSANAGFLDVRAAVADRTKKIWNLKKCDFSNIMLTVGGMEALYLSLLAIIDDGDEVIVFAPYYVNYVQMITMCGGKPITLDAYTPNGFETTREMLSNVITSKTVAVIVNSPNNPTGDVLDKNFLKTVYQVAIENNLYILSDEVYRTLIYDNQKHNSILEFDSNLERTILIDSMSKEFSMTGWRAGYVCANEILVQNMVKLQENIAACVSTPSQYAMLYAYKNSINNNYIVEEFEKRRNFIYNNISKIEKLSCLKPRGTFYIFVNIEKTGLTSEEFSEKLLESEHVAVVPGIAYGKNYDNYIRIAFTKKIDMLGEATKRVSSFLQKISCNNL